MLSRDGWWQSRYEVDSTLGPAVSLGRDRLTGGYCVLKRAAVDQPGALEREHARALSLRHPAIRGLSAALRTDDGPLLVLEHVEGQTPEPTRSVAIQLLRVLLHLHDKGLVHGDLKPDNLLQEGSRLRLIDLAFATRIGARVVGGTSAFLAPEYLRGAPASVAGDLYAFGKTLRALGPIEDQAAAAIVERACEEDPARRPASAATALAELGELALPADRAGELPWAGSDVFGPLDQTLRASAGETHLLVLPRGGGRTRAFEELRRRAAARWAPLADLSTGPAALTRLRPDVVGGLAERSLRLGAWLGARGIGVLVDDADRVGEDGREALVALARGLAVERGGALILIGAGPELVSDFAASARVTEAAPLDVEAVASLLARAGARSNVQLARALHERSEGRAGLVAEAAMALARDPERSDAELLADLRSRETRVSEEPVDPKGARAFAEEALARGEGRAALRLLRSIPEEDSDIGVLRARAFELSGQLEEALDELASSAPGRGTWRARLAARLGRYAQALELAEDDAEGCAVAASAALALGRVDEVDARVSRGLARDPSPAQRLRFSLIESDAALRLGRIDDALAHGRAALDGARSARDVAEARSRLGSACALGDDPEGAREQHLAALEAAHEAGDVAALPSYVVNVATAHHALGELGVAIARYEEAARLSERLGREAMRAVALTNLGGLLVGVGARIEAQAVLEAAALAAERSGARLYAAQVELIEAERLVPEEKGLALETVRRARARFEDCGASRQVLEASLLEAELSDDEGFVDRNGAALEEAGLGARADLLAARVAFDAGRFDRAADRVERAIASAHEGAIEARAWSLSARIAARRQAPDADERRLRAREAFESVADSLPPGLRERFLAEAPPSPAARSVPRLSALGDGGRRILLLLRRVLLERDERRVLEAAVDEAIALTGAERAFLLRREHSGDGEVLVARNLDRDTIRSGRFSRSVAESVLDTSEPVLTEMAIADPALAGARSVADLGLRSILCVPVRGPTAEVTGALYLDHRFESARFGGEDLELVGALADVIGLALENARLHREARERALELERANAEIRDENVRAAIRLEQLEQRLAAGEGEEIDPASGIVGRSRSLRRALAVARRVAPSDLSVLLEGESGTGKELFARLVHRESHRREGPFLAVNCGALPETLLESELFGHVRGAFTGAHRDHPGLFRSAEGGTLFLDEIGEMPARMQTRLLRVLQEREVRAVGAESADVVDVRIVAATNRDLEREVEAGSFRRDLYFRLVGVQIVLPPLRERPDDIPALAAHALSRIADEPGMRAVKLSKAARGALLTHAWPGNVRELEQALRRAVLVSEGELVEPEDLALGGGATLDRRTALRRFDRKLVAEALSAADGNRTAAARALGVSRMTIHRWIKRHGL